MCPYPLVLSLGSSKKGLALPSVLLHHQMFIHIDRIPPSLLFSRLNRARSPHFSSYERCSSPLMIFVAHGWTCLSKSMSFLNWGGKTAGKTGNLVHFILVLYKVHVFYYSSTAHTCRLYRLMKLRENPIIFQSAVRMKEMLFSSWRSLYCPMKLWKVSSAS